MKFYRNILMVGLVVHLLLWSLFFINRLNIPAEIAFANDTASYHAGAIHIAETGFYSLDGTKPMLDREPGYSLFLGFLYTLFGTGNRIAIFIAQEALFIISVTLFALSLRKHVQEKAVTICVLLLLFLPPVFHLTLKVYRESVALSLGLLFAGAFLCLMHDRKWYWGTLSGTLLGVLILTYIPLLLFPVLLVGIALYAKVSWKHIIPLICIPMLLLAVWFVRNAAHNSPQLLSPHRTASVWAMRSAQAERFSASDPLECIWNEYVTRDWSGIPREQCRAEGFEQAAWVEGMAQDFGYTSVTREARIRILQHLPMYLWGSFFWALEYHLPYINGWGRAYNILALIGACIVYIGCMLALVQWRTHNKILLTFCIALALYSTAMFALTYAEPRYRTPILFCYTTVAAMGYSSIGTKKVQ